MKEETNFSPEEFIDDPIFRQWVLSPNEETNNIWKQYIAKHPEKKKEIEIAVLLVKSLQTIDEKISSFEKQELWERIYNSTIKVENNNSKRLRKLYITIAAAAAILLLITVSFWAVNFYFYGPNEINYATMPIPETADDQISLILSDNSKIRFQDKNSHFEYSKDGTIKLNADSAITQSTNQNSSGEKGFNQIIVPYGKRAQLTFNDGTKMWLNSGSRAIYPIEFGNNKREVYIEGEAFFEVETDKNRPFVIVSDLVNISVTGTSFNLSTYKNDDIVSVLLLEGKISAEFKKKSKVNITPNQVYEYSRIDHQLHSRVANTHDTPTWREGWIQCNREELSSITRKLSRYYNKEIIIIDSEINSFRFTGKLDLKDNIEDVMKIISRTAPIKAVYENERIILTKVPEK